MSTTLNYVQIFYTYLKDKYGVVNTETFDPENDLLKGITLEISDLKKNSENHSVGVFIEEAGKKLIFVEKNKSYNNEWSRIIQIKNSDHFPGSAWLKLVQSVILGQGHDRENILVLLHIVEQFDSLYKERTQT